MKRLFSTLALAIILMSSQAYAFGLTDLTKSVDGGGSDVDVDSLTNQQTEIVKNLASSLLNLSESQAIIAEALGLKEEAALASNSASSLENGTFTGDDHMEQVVSNTLSVQKKINEKISKGEKLGEDSKKKFATSLPPYGKGTAKMIIVVKKASDAAQSLSSTKDLTVLTKLSNLIYVARKSPDLISTFSSSTSSIITFSSNNGIDTTELKKSTDEWS